MEPGDIIGVKAEHVFIITFIFSVVLINTITYKQLSGGFNTI
jgi:hypothetical protein